MNNYEILTESQEPTITELAVPEPSEFGPNAEWMGHFEASVRGAGDWPSLTTLAQRFALACGFERFLFLIDIPQPCGASGSFVMSTYPREWMSIYIDQKGAEFDPILAAGMTRMIPFDWAEIPKTHPRSMEMLNQAALYGIRSGCAAPVRGPKMSAGVFNMACSKEASTLKGMRRHQILWLSMRVAHLMLERSLDLAEQQRARYASQPGKLSAQDVDLLKKVGHGTSIESLKNEDGFDLKGFEARMNRILKRLGGNDLNEALVRASVLGLVPSG